MVFSIDSFVIPQKKVLIYRIPESSFDMMPYTDDVDFTLLLNYLEFGVGEDQRISRIDGYCPVGSWTTVQLSPPKSDRGSLVVSPQLESGRSYRVNLPGDWPIYRGETNDWICVGNKEFNGESVEFLDGCTAFINNGQLISLWLIPKFIS